MEKKTLQDRASLLADVAEMYYLEEKNQAEIAKTIGVTRSMVSRMLTEARESGIVEIRIQRPLQSDPELESALEREIWSQGCFCGDHQPSKRRKTHPNSWKCRRADACALSRPPKDLGIGMGHIHQRHGGCV